MEMSGQLHTLLSLSLVPIVLEFGWAFEPLWTSWRSENSLIPAGYPAQGYWTHSLITMHTILISVLLNDHKWRKVNF